MAATGARGRPRTGGPSTRAGRKRAPPHAARRERREPGRPQFSLGQACGAKARLEAEAKERR